MNTLLRLSSILLVCLALCSPALGQAEELKPLQLPKPQMDGGKPLMQVLKERKSTRVFSAQKLPEQTLSNLLWQPSVSAGRMAGAPRLPPAIARRSTSMP